ncbi:FAD:protein FMN transferase [Tissierella sp.]|uniref:FAD:protein FMN transferase n=1 Tax=Tissierella sp. TaxID=41274 RepID=UPI0028AA3E1F|nr:FAD:protein FMN transferase [Tissierella sp.]
MKKIKDIRLIIILALIVGVTGCTNKHQSKDTKLPSESNLISKTEPISRTEFLMNTVMTIKIYDNNDESILDKVFSRLKEIENRMSVTLNGSDVNKINENAGIKPVTINEDTYFVVNKAKYYAEISDGACDPTIGPLVNLWNISSGEKNRTSIPKSEEIEEKRSYVNYKNLELLDNNQVFLKERNMKIDLGSIVKGYAADEVSRILIENGVKSAIIDLGGNIFTHGEKQDGSYWNIGIQDPFKFTGNYLGILKAKNNSIVTSGDYERFFEYNGKRYHHILDTKTGYPTENELSGVCIISNKSIDGDALSTTLFVLGLDNGIDLVNSLEYVEAIFITKDKSIYISENLKDKFTLGKENTSFIIKQY